MKSCALRPSLIRLLIGVAPLLAVGCIKVPDGPHAEVTLPCPQEVTDSLSPTKPCVTVASSRSSACHVSVSIDCGNAMVGPHRIQPGTQDTLCCPNGGNISKINVRCDGEGGECHYYIVIHDAGAPTRRRCFW